MLIKIYFHFYFLNKDNLSYKGKVPAFKYFKLISDFNKLDYTPPPGFRRSPQVLDLNLKNENYLKLSSIRLLCHIKHRDVISVHHILAQFRKTFNLYRLDLLNYSTISSVKRF